MPLLIKESYWNGAEYANGLLSDLSLDISKKWGSDGAIGTGLLLVFPTGRTTIPRTTTRILPPELQIGGGVFGGSARLTYTIDRDWGLISLGSSYAGGFLAMITDEYRFDETQGKPVPDKKSPRISRDGMRSLNDEGTVNPDNVSLLADVEIKMQSLAHGFSIAFSQPFHDGRWEDRITTSTDWSSNLVSAAKYLPTKAIAQIYADTLTDQQGAKQYEHPFVVCTRADSVGTEISNDWVVVDHKWIEQKAFPSVSLQYSLEKGDLLLPLLFGGAVRLDFNKGIRFGGFTAGLGLKFPIY